MELKSPDATTAESMQDLLGMYDGILRIRRFEEEAFRLALEGKYSNYHAGLGQEAIPVGLCYGLRKTDKTMITHRGLGVLLMRGVSMQAIMAGLYAKATSPTRGRIPIYHLAAPDLGIAAGTTMVGSVIPLATGAALATRIEKRDDVTISFFGDGAVNRGDFHEGINLAAIWKLPIVYVCENNFYAKSMSIHQSTAGADIAGRAKAYGIPGYVVDGNDLPSVRQVAAHAIARARAGEGPSLIEAQTYRWTPHSTAGDREFRRTKEEIETWKKKDPLRSFGNLLKERFAVTEAKLDEMDRAVRREVAAAIAAAEAAPSPGPAVAFENVYR